MTTSLIRFAKGIEFDVEEKARSLPKLEFYKKNTSDLLENIVISFIDSIQSDDAEYFDYLFRECYSSVKIPYDLFVYEGNPCPMLEFKRPDATDKPYSMDGMFQYGSVKRYIAGNELSLSENLGSPIWNHMIDRNKLKDNVHYDYFSEFFRQVHSHKKLLEEKGYNLRNLFGIRVFDENVDLSPKSFPYSQKRMIVFNTPEYPLGLDCRGITIRKLGSLECHDEI